MIDSNLLEILVNAGISKCQSELIQETFSAAKLKNAKNRKYNENWMLLSLIFQIRDQVYTAAKVVFGFDPDFFKLLIKNFAKKSDSQEVGILSFDKIIYVNTRALTYYTGLDDFENEINHNTASSEKSNHGADLAKLLLEISTNEEDFKNYFEKPFNSSRKIFKKQLKIHPSKPFTKWDHLSVLVNMLFSYLAAGIQFYKNKNYLEYLKELKKILETEIFREYTSHRTRKPNPILTIF
ncbi:Uncharacterized protein FWK35_00016087 [Aphis craccivora]|uniref:Uncharacterized protein n=1 Tax=Aphis craccivora TaxID=307492 RepID=A0A6G0YTY4_APHCR|nr:Uncharacterized protein FWK35_00016087 [Aphis craccivora]